MKMEAEQYSGGKRGRIGTKQAKNTFKKCYLIGLVIYEFYEFYLWRS